MDYAKIINKIFSNLTGNRERDLNYLLGQSEKYKDHVYSQEILRAIGRKLYELIPEEKRGEFNKIFDNENTSREEVLIEVKRKINEGKLNEAEKLIKTILPPKDRFTEDKVSVYFAFNEPIEEVIYSYIYEPEKKIRVNPTVKTEIFLTYAYILIEQGLFDKALIILDEGLKHNPVDVGLIFEKSEVYKLKKGWTKLKKIIDQAFKHSYRSTDISRAYRNLGFMFIEMEDYDAAICCYLMSSQYEETEMAQSQLYYISQKIGKFIDVECYFERLEQVLLDRHVQIGPSEDVIGLAYTIGRDCEQNGNIELASYFYSIVYDLTGDEEIKLKLDELSDVI